MKKTLCIILSILLYSTLASAEDKVKRTLSIKDQYLLQEKCGESASQYFKQYYGVGTQDTAIGILSSSWSNHYNKQMNKCFILIESSLVSEKSTSKTKRLHDIQEHKEYGFFLEEDEPKMIVCNVLKKKCKSESEWDSRVKKYMEN